LKWHARKQGPIFSPPEALQQTVHPVYGGVFILFCSACSFWPSLVYAAKNSGQSGRRRSSTAPEYTFRKDMPDMVLLPLQVFLSSCWYVLVFVGADNDSQL
jgi:hypothetical protein